MITPQEYDRRLQQWRDSGTTMDFLSYWALLSLEFRQVLIQGIGTVSDTNPTE